MGLKKRFTKRTTVISISIAAALALLFIVFIALPQALAAEFGYLDQRVRMQDGAAEVTDWEGCYSTWTYFSYDEFAEVAADMWEELAERYPDPADRTMEGATVARLVRQVELPDGNLGEVYLTQEELWAIPYLTEAARAYGFRTAWLKEGDAVRALGNTDLVTVAVDGVCYHEYRFSIPMTETLLRMMADDKVDEMVIHPDIVLPDGRRVSVTAYRTVMEQELAYAEETNCATIALRHHWLPEYTPHWGDTGFWYYQVQRFLQGIVDRTGCAVKTACVWLSCLIALIIGAIARGIKKLWRWQKRKRIVRRCRRLTSGR